VQFQHGLIEVSTLLVAASLIAAGFLIAGIWIRIGVSWHRRLAETVATMAIMAVVLVGCSFVQPSWDLSEGRINSFTVEQEAFLRRIWGPLDIEVHLAPEDPRRQDLERNALSKLRRVVPELNVTYVSSTAIGLFEQTSEHYGEIQYRVKGNTIIRRATTQEGVFEAIADLVGEEPPEGTAVFRGQPLITAPRGAAILFYACWPLLVVVGAFFLWRQR
jgi:hypothetical protein